MELLLVHRDPEIGPALVQMIKEHTGHNCELVATDAAALNWGRRHRKCDLLLTQVTSPGIHGLVLGSSLSEIFPSLHVLFFPAYAAAEQRLEVSNTKVFPEPIQGDALLEAIERSEKTSADTPDLFHVIDVLQMCCLSHCSGAIQLVRDERSGLVFVQTGKIVHAETSSSRGQKALSEIVAWEKVEFAYKRSVQSPLETITLPWDDALIQAVTRQKEEKTLPSQRQSV